MPINPTQQDFDPKQILYDYPPVPLKPELHYEDRTRHVPLMTSMPHPGQYPTLTFPQGTSFLSADEYFVDENARVYFHDWQSGQKVYMSEVDTTNHIRLSQATMIMNDLSKHANRLHIPGTNRDTVVKANRFSMKFWHNENTIAYTDANGAITFSLNRNGKGISDNIYEIVSNFRHELIHIRDNHHVKYAGKSKEVPYLEHAEVYKEQMKYDEFNNTSWEYQYNCIVMYVRLVISGYHYPNSIFDVNKIYNHFYKFNNDKELGIKIKATISYSHDTNPNKRIIEISLKGTTKTLVYKKVVDEN